MIAFTDNGTSIEVNVDGDILSVSKEGLVIKTLPNNTFGLFSGGHWVVQGTWAEVSSPSTADAAELVETLSSWLVDTVVVSGVDAWDDAILVELQNGHLDTIDTSTADIKTAVDLTNTYLTVVMSNVSAINTNTANTVNGVDTTNNHLSVGNVARNTVVTNTGATVDELETVNTNLQAIYDALDLVVGASGKDFFLQAALGEVPSTTYRAKTAKRQNLGTSAERLWAASSGSFTFQSAGVVSVVSSSANDTAAGTGARTVQIQGFDAGYAFISEIVTLNGTTPVNSVNSYTRITNAVVLTAGSAESNVGNVSLTNITLQEFIPAGVGQGQSSLVTTEDSKSMLVRINLSAATETYAGITPPTVYVYKRSSTGLRTRIAEIKLYEKHVVDNILLNSREDLYIEAFSTVDNIPVISLLGVLDGVANDTDVYAVIETITF